MNKNNQKKEKIMPYKQRVLGSNPCAPTTMIRVSDVKFETLFCFILWRSPIFYFLKHLTDIILEVRMVH